MLQVVFFTAISASADAIWKGEKIENNYECQ